MKVWIAVLISAIYLSSTACDARSRHNRGHHVHHRSHHRVHVTRHRDTARHDNRSASVDPAISVKLAMASVVPAFDTKKEAVPFIDPLFTARKTSAYPFDRWIPLEPIKVRTIHIRNFKVEPSVGPTKRQIIIGIILLMGTTLIGCVLFLVFCLWGHKEKPV